jgi:hypothetical protein
MKRQTTLPKTIVALSLTLAAGVQNCAHAGTYIDVSK